MKISEHVQHQKHDIYIVFFEHANLMMFKQCGEAQQVLTLQLEKWTGVSLNSDDVLNRFFEWIDGGYMCGSETIWVFLSQEIF